MSSEEKIKEAEEDIITSSGARLTEAQWQEIVTLYEMGLADAGELATRFGIKSDTLRKRFTRHKIRKGSRAEEVAKSASTAVKTAVAETVRKFAENRSENTEKTLNEQFQWTSFLQRAIISKTNDALKSGAGKLDGISGDIKALRFAISAMVMGGQHRLGILGYEPKEQNDDLPDLVIRELTNEEIFELQNSGDENDDVGVEIGEPDGSDDDGVVEEL